MGNCHCRPREGGENLREYLARKFRSLAGKRKIDDLVTIAIQVEGACGARTDTQLNLEDIEDYETDDDDGSEDSDCAVFKRVTNNECTSKNIDIVEDKRCKKTEEEQTLDPPCRQKVVQYQEDNDYIRVLQQQLQQVQKELADLHRGKIVRCQPEVSDREQDEIISARALCSRQSDEIKAADAASIFEIDDPLVTSTHRSPRNTLQAQGDVRGRSKKSTISISPIFDVTVVAADDNAPQNNGRRNKVKGMVSEGLRTRSDVSHQRTKAKNRLKPKDDFSVEDIDGTKLAEKIARLQKRDPALHRPDKGIVYPKTLANLSDVDKAYYVEQFLRSELFRQRCLRKYQGSKTWMNGLSSFQLWVLENEGTADIENVLHPLAKRQNNAQAKVKCWRGDTPPPSPKSP